MSYINEVIILNVVPLRLITASFQNIPFFPHQFGQEENISGNSIETRVY